LVQLSIDEFVVGQSQLTYY